MLSVQDFFRKNISAFRFSIILSVLNLLFFHYRFFSFVWNNLDFSTFGSTAILVSLFIAMIVANSFFFYLLVGISRPFAKFLIALFFIINSVAVYFVNTYSTIIDESMIGNVFNTNYSESSSFFSLSLILYVLLLGILSAIFIFRAKIIKDTIGKFWKNIGLSLGFLLILVFANASNWLWIDKNSKTLGGLAMPWNYTVNSILYYKHYAEKNQKEILLPSAKIGDNQKSVVVLVIGESSRRANYSLYGYNKDTNPLLEKTPNLYHFDANSSATYTTAGVKSILESEDSGDLYEPLPNYLFRNGADVIWHTTNWGEPPLHIKNYEKTEDLQKICKGANCGYDEVLLAGLKEQILASKSNKVLVVLHTSTSHGPSYSKKYPKNFEKFSPVCNSVELGKCSQTELINAYDNTILYTDFLLHSVIEDLQSLKDYKSSMIFVSDHGESLGEKNLYMHGIPMSIAPKEQYEIPFIVWVSEGSKGVKPLKTVNQNFVFHSVLNFLNIQSPVYKEDMNIYK